MKILMWGHKDFDHPNMIWLVLWDGENTYWTDEMKGSGVYNGTLEEMEAEGFTLVGEL